MKNARSSRRIVVAWIARHAHASSDGSTSQTDPSLADQGLDKEICSGILRYHFSVVLHAILRASITSGVHGFVNEDRGGSRYNIGWKVACTSTFDIRTCIAPASHHTL